MVYGPASFVLSLSSPSKLQSFTSHGKYRRYIFKFQCCILHVADNNLLLLADLRHMTSAGHLSSQRSPHRASQQARLGSRSPNSIPSSPTSVYVLTPLFFLSPNRFLQPFILVRHFRARHRTHRPTFATFPRSPKSSSYPKSKGHRTTRELRSIRPRQCSLSSCYPR